MPGHSGGSREGEATRDNGWGKIFSFVVGILRHSGFLGRIWFYGWGAVRGRGFGLLFCLGENARSGGKGDPVVKHVDTKDSVMRFDYGYSYAPHL